MSSKQELSYLSEFRPAALQGPRAEWVNPVSAEVRPRTAHITFNLSSRYHMLLYMRHRF